MVNLFPSANTHTPVLFGSGGRHVSIETVSILLIYFAAAKRQEQMNCTGRAHLLFFGGGLLVLLLVSCHNNETINEKNVDPQSIYFDYRVWGDEDGGYMTTRLQYRVGATNLLLISPSKAELDGVVMRSDSSKMNGIYYELAKPVKEFTGAHTIVFTDRNGKQYREEFDFQPISLKKSLPAVIQRADLVLEIDGLKPNDPVKLMLSDTASFSEGIDRVDTVKNGRIVITADDLQKLASGPVHLELSREDERRIRNGTRRGGKLVVLYELKREFELKD
jgi:hypothetical protein